MCRYCKDRTVLTTGNGEVPLFRMTMPLKHFLLLPGWPASAALLLSRVGCRCAGTSRPIRRSREEADAPSRSTADGVPLTPVLLRFHLNTAEDRREKWFTVCGSSGGCEPIKVRGWRRGGGADNPSPVPLHDTPPVMLRSGTTKKVWLDGALNGTKGVKVKRLFIQFYGQTKLAP